MCVLYRFLYGTLFVGVMAKDLLSTADGTLNKTLSIIIVLTIIGGVIGLIFTSLGSIVENFTLVDTGNTTLDLVISGALVLVVGFGIVLGIVRLIQKAVN